MSVMQLVSSVFVKTPISLQRDEYDDRTPAERCNQAFENFLAVAARYKQTAKDSVCSARLLRATSENVVKCLGCPERSHGDGECSTTCEQE